MLLLLLIWVRKNDRNKIYFEIENSLDITSKMYYIPIVHLGALLIHKCLLPSGLEQIIVQVFILHLNLFTEMKCKWSVA